MVQHRPATSNLATLTFSVDISALSIPRLRYFTFQNNTNTPGDNATLYVIVNGTDTVDMYASDNAAWVERTVDLSSYSGVVSFAFKADHNGMTGSQFYADVLIDDVSIEETPTCFAVSALTATTTSGTTADVSWTDPNGASEWRYRMVLGFAAGSGTESIVSSATASLSGLSEQIMMLVRAICSVEIQVHGVVLLASLHLVLRLCQHTVLISQHSFQVLVGMRLHRVHRLQVLQV